MPHVIIMIIIIGRSTRNLHIEFKVVDVSKPPRFFWYDTRERYLVQVITKSTIFTILESASLQFYLYLGTVVLSGQRNTIAFRFVA